MDITKPLSQKAEAQTFPSHVLFQLILLNFLHAQSLFKELTILNPDHSLQILKQLVNEASPHRNHFSWHIDDGFISKIKNNSTLLRKKEKTVLFHKIQRYASKTWMTCLEMHEFLACYSKDSEFSNRKFKKLQELMHKILQKLGNSIEKAIFFFAQNENVALFLLRQKENLDVAYGSGFTKKTLKKMYSDLDGARFFLDKSYQKREFKWLLQEILDCIEELKNA